jgi:hypothetical protein
LVTLVYHKKLTDAWMEAAQKLRPVLGACPSSRSPLTTIVGRSHKQKIELDCGHVTERLQAGATLRAMILI